MKCWHCDKELIWGGDHDIEDCEEYTIVTNLSCPECDSVFCSSQKLAAQGKHKHAYLNPFHTYVHLCVLV